MTTGFVVFGAALPLYASALRRALPGGAWITAAGTGLATLAVAATPLDRSATVDRWHGVFAGVGYVTLAATPLLAARPLRRIGADALACWGIAAGLASGLALGLSTIASLPHGLLQRAGLTATDAWIAACAVAIARARSAAA
jgi:hypothetical protein